MNAVRRIQGRAFVDGAFKDDMVVSFAEGRITDVAHHARGSAETAGGVIVPGFVDVHVHGGDGADFMDADDAATARVLSFHASHGTTALLATTLSGSTADLQKAVESIARVAASSPPGAEICGVHLEGPYLNRKHAGAQDVHSIRPADASELGAILAAGPRLRWIVTLAPEVEGARELIQHYKDRVLFSIGHTSADYAEAVAGLAWGASHFTHLYNAMTGMHHREPGVVGAALGSVDATVELIADGVHVHPAVLRITATMLPRRTALVTDAVRACGMPDGNYKLYGYEINVADGAARLSNSGALAGSVLTMTQAVQNMVELAGLPIELVIPLATEVPARIAGVADRKGRLEIGYDADIVVLTEKFEAARVFARGQEVSR